MRNGLVLCFPGTRVGFAEALTQFRRALDGHRLADRPRYMSELVFEEIATNIIRHGYADTAEHLIKVSLDVRADVIVLCFEDDGVAFDPRERALGPGGAATGSLAVGGNGLPLVGKAARQLNYERTADGRNRLTVTLAQE